MLVAGRVKVLYGGREGAEILLAVRGPGDLLGEFSGMDDGPRSATIQAMEPCIGSVVSEVRFAEFLRRQRIGPQLDRYVMAKVRQSASHVWQVARYRTSVRLAALLQEVVAVAGPDHPHPHVVPMSQDELASALGVVRSSVTPVLATWRRDGLIDTGRARVVVVDPDRLWREATND